MGKYHYFNYEQFYIQRTLPSLTSWCLTYWKRWQGHVWRGQLDAGKCGSRWWHSVWERGWCEGKYTNRNKKINSRWQLLVRELTDFFFWCPRLSPHILELENVKPVLALLFCFGITQRSCITVISIISQDLVLWNNWQYQRTMDNQALVSSLSSY